MIQETLPGISVDAHVIKAAAHLGEAVRFETVSRSDFASIDQSRFVALQDWLLKTYPLAAAQLEPFRRDPWSLRFHWKGADANAAPLILLAHYDVVPPGKAESWKHPAFSGEIHDGEVWGRGTLDVKINMVSIMEAVEQALSEGFVPQRDIWLCFGGDEEISGTRGAGSLCKDLEDLGVSNASLVDEGGAIALGSVAFVKKPLALIGVAEKGFTNMVIKAPGSPGHSSMPPKHTAAGVLAKAVVRIEKNPFPMRCTKTLEGFLKGLAPLASPALGVLLAHPRLFWPVIRKVLGTNPRMAAMLRTCQAVTMLNASEAENVLPAQAKAIINVRILPGETIASVLEHYQGLLKGTGCTVEEFTGMLSSNPSGESAMSGPAWECVTRAVHHAEPEAVALPYLVTASTDTKYYGRVASNIYRIMAVVLTPEQVDLIHSPNERISLENIGRSLRFYSALIRS